MATRLVKIASELNVGTSTIVEYLNNHGFEIEDKPSAKVTDEMHEVLVKEFQKDRVIKEQADQLIFGTRPATTQRKDAPIKEKPASTGIKEKEEVAILEVKKEESAPVVERPRLLQSRLKVIGKIDLDKQTNPIKPAELETPPPPVVEPPVEQPTVPPTPVVEEVLAKEPQKTASAKPAAPEPTKPPVAEPVSPAPKTAPEEVTPSSNVFRAEAPELRGLKILGKIDTDKFKKPKKKKEKEKPKPAAPAVPAQDANKPKPATPAPDSASDADKKKRRRKRKKITTQADGKKPETSGNQGQGQQRRGNDQPRGGEQKDDAILQREIEEKIKATMARLSGGGKKKRQKMRRDNRERIRERQEQLEQEGQSDKIQVTEFVSVSELASLLNVAVTDVITACLNLGVIVSINQRLDAEIIELIVEEFGHEVEFISVEEQTEEEEEIIDAPEDLKPRAPIVTVMGHVDHGKTSLLDYIREANVVRGEAGGITQHIGAYEVEVSGKKITFLDTPGHEAFTAMRARGAKITDIAVIVIAADDSIMPQTREAISHAQAANVPLIFAINKIDKQNAAPEKIKQELANMNLLVEEWGGKYQSQDISAKTGLNIDLLLEKILLEAEILELKANPKRMAIGTVIEASLDKGRGYVSKILVQNGTLDIGDPVVAGEYSGKVKAMFNERGKRVQQVGPSTPVLVLGLNGAPQAGERFKEIENEQEARQIASKRAQIAREQANRATKRISLDEIGRRLALGNFKELNLIVKGDVDGS
ncbi:MAG TPA: translation initiation factor IF-2, partial [Saprospiraceae bacterium]|nr:translation initiation factor IF-2 [Saprospiraceae bacterium]